MYVTSKSYLYTVTINENVHYSYFEKQNGDTSDKNNYRSIAIYTAMLKLFELCLSKILDEYLCTSEKQFGLKKKHATDLCIYKVKYDNYFSIPVFTFYLDAGMAFDRVNL